MLEVDIGAAILLVEQKLTSGLPSDAGNDTGVWLRRRPTNCLQASKWRVVGRPGRIRTCDITVMSGSF